MKDVPASKAVFPSKEIPYEGAKPMLLVDREDPDLVASVIEEMLQQLPKPKSKR